jgi:hypothetical protein
VTCSPNVELVRSIYADRERDDFRNTSWAHPQLEVVTVDVLTGIGALRGLQPTAPAWREFLADWQNFQASFT